jgi:putative ABC transport system permease protein
MSPHPIILRNLVNWLLAKLSEEEISVSIFDYLSDKHDHLVRESGRFWAITICSIHLFSIIFSLIFAKMYWSLVMFKNYLKIAFRNIRKQKAYSAINIMGLTVGMACSILILLWVQYEFSFDRFHENFDDIYRIKSDYYGVGNRLHTSTYAPYPLLETLKNDYPEVINYTRILDFIRLRAETDKLMANNIRYAYVTPNFLEFFNFPVLDGDTKTSLINRNSIVITEDIAIKFFGRNNPVGETMLLFNRKAPFTVSGVVKNIPENSHIKFDILINETVGEYQNKNPDNWKIKMVGNYLLINKDFDKEEFEEKIFSLIKRHNSDQYKDVSLQPMKDIHLKSGFDIDAPNYNRGDFSEVILYMIFAVIVLLIACINFTSLSTANALKRSKEVGVRKVCGASKGDIIKQFFGESMVFSFIASFFSIFLVYLSLPLFEQITGRDIHLELLSKSQYVIAFFLIPFLTGLLSGAYPALFLSAFQPVSVMKNMFTTGKGSRFNFRSSVVTIQYIFAISLLTGMIIIYSQMNYINKKNLGFDKDNIISIYPPIENSRRGVFKDELLKNPNVLNVSYGFIPVRDDYGHPARKVNWEGKDPGLEIDMDYFPADHDYLETMGIELLSGRYFSRDFPKDKNNFVVNESAVKMMGYENPIGKRFSMEGDTGGEIVEGEIIGVVKDFFISSMRVKLLPFVFTLSNRYGVIIRINSSDRPETIKHIEKVWKTFIPERPFEVSYLDENINNMYSKEHKVGTILKTSTFLSIVVFCLGLFALISFITEQRTKEIGIRKVLGANIREIVFLILKEFVILFIIAFMISSPIAYFLMDKWLMNFIYKIDISLWIFILSGAVTLGMTLFTVGFRTIRAAIANPVDSLRYE